MQKRIKFFFLPLRSSHSSRGGFKKQKQSSTISGTIEVGCNYSGNTEKEVSDGPPWMKREISQR